MLKGIARCLEQPGALRKEMINSPDFWVVLRTLHSVDDVAMSVFSIIEDLTANRFSDITADNYEAAVLLLNDFASAGSVGASLEQRQDVSGRRGKPPKSAQAEWVIQLWMVELVADIV